MSNIENAQLTIAEENAVIKARIVRSDRDQAIAQSDWTQMPDVSLTAEQKAAWADYRQALRDVPEQPGFPWSVQWPAKP